MDETDIESFQKIDMRVGTVQRAEVYEKARNPSFKLWIQFGGDLGVKKTSAQITDLYDPQDLIGKQVIAVVNFPPRQIGTFMSEVLVLGLDDGMGAIVLLAPEREVPDGARVH